LPQGDSSKIKPLIFMVFAKNRPEKGKTKFGKKRGFSLFEVVFAVTIFALVAGFIYKFAFDVFTQNRFLVGQIAAQDQARNALKYMVSEIRTMSPSSTGAYPLAQAGNQSLAFYANIDSDSYIERIRYFVSSSTLKRGVLKPTGNPLIYNPANEMTSPLIVNLAVGAADIFSYFNSSYNGTGPAMTFPIATSQVRVIKMTFLIDVIPNKSPVPLEVSSQVSIRNLKDN
jgi:prepilin-type N-terminal cleavage/methylation domain-containing protein